MAENASTHLSLTLASVVLVASRTLTHLYQQDPVLCRVVRPDGRDHHFKASLSSEVTVSEYLRDASSVVDPSPHQPNLTILLGKEIRHTDLPTTSTVVVPVRGDPYFSDVGQRSAWSASRFAVALDALRNSSDSTLLSEIPVISSEEQNCLLKWAVAPLHARCEEQTLIHKYFEKVAQETPDFFAIHSIDDARATTTTYGELDQFSNALSTHLVQELGICVGDLVLLFFEKGPEMLAAILAVLKAGAAYVPLDIDYPAARIRSIQGMTRAKLCLTTTSLRARIPNLESIFICVDKLQNSLDGSAPPVVPSRSITGEDLCYVMFTSGSTGQPKGVMVTHSSVISSVIDGPETVQNLRKQGQKLRTLAFVPYSFDVSVWDIFITLTSGGTLCVSPKMQMLNDLAGTIRSLSVTFLEATPTVLSLVDPSQVPSLTTVFSTGEPLSQAVREKFQPHYPRITLCNAGGPTETTVMSIFAELHSRSTSGIFGRPFGGNRAYILDQDRRLCAVGSVGHLWIGGPQVSKGYLGRDDLTAAVYASDPFNGGRMYNTGDLCMWAPASDGSEEYALIYLGRADTQVKIRGQRIETGEIEAVLDGVKGVKASGVIKRVYYGTEELVAFVELANSAVNTTVLKEVNIALQRLPRYMVPSAIITLPALPVTANGKLHRKDLERMALEMKEDIGTRNGNTNGHLNDEANGHGNGHANGHTNGHANSHGTHLNGHTNGVLAHKLLSATEQVIRDVWATVLHRPAENIALDDDFYGIGGDSISCIRVAAACRSAGYSLSIIDFVEAPTVSSQARLVKLRTQVHATEVEYGPFELLADQGYQKAVEQEVVSYGLKLDDIEDAYPSTPSVAGLISLAVENPLSYFAQYTYCAPSKFEPECMYSAWCLLLRRHEILRTVFVVAPPPYNDVVQVVLNDRAAPLSWMYRGFDDDLRRDAAVDEYIKQAPGFALGTCPTRVGLFHGPRSSTLVFEMHHSQYDGWTFPNLLQDLETAYAISSGRLTGWMNNPTPYAHFSRWSLGQDTNNALAYWRSQLTDSALPSWPKVPVFNARKKAVTDQSLMRTFSMSKQLADFCAAQRVTLSSCVRTALALSLGIHESSGDVIFGVVTSGRTGEIPGIETIFGPCISTVPCRVHLPPTESLESVLQVVHSQSAESSPYQFVGLNQILKTANIDADIFRVLLTIQNVGLHESEHQFLGKNIRGHLLEMNYPLAISVFPSPDSNDLQFQFQYDYEYLSVADIDWFKEHLFSTLTALMQHPQTSVADSNFLSPMEAKFVREIGVGTPPKSGLDSEFFHRMVDATAARSPANIALEHTDGETMTYGALVSLANQVAHALQSKGVQPEICVPVLFNKNANQIEAVVAILGILKASGAFVPLDSTWPESRLASCIEQTKAKFFICDSSAPSVAHRLPAPFVTVPQLALKQPTTAPSTPTLKMDNLCYVMFTSGSSTGKPKGVLLEHSNASAYISNASTLFPLADARRFLHFSPWTFDQGLADLFLAFPVGATVILANMDEMLLDLTATLNSTQADYAVLTPAVAQLIQAGTNLPYLKTLACGGEKMPGQLIHRWGGKLELIDAYGPTEFTIHGISESFKHAGYVPGVIGRPLGSTRAYIVNHSMLPVPVGATGELMLSGNQVARGYLNLPAETAAAFIADPFHPGQRMYRSGDLARFRSDGRIEYLGRQEGGYVKLRGLRIDVGEIEATLMSAPQTLAVVELLVLEEQSHLVAFVAQSLSPAGQAQLGLSPDLPALQPWIKVLLKTCKRVLPTYSVPTLWIALEAIPQATSNKYDRKLLRTFFEKLAAQPGQVDEITRILIATKPARRPETDLEIKLHAIWCELLGKDQMSVNDDYFNIGGDSLGAIRVLARLRNKGCHLTIKDFYAASTIASLADFIKSSGQNIDAEVSENPVLGLVYPVQSDAGDNRKLPLWLFHCAEGVGHEYMNLPPLERDVYAISNPSKNRMSLEANFPDLESFTDKYMTLISVDKPVLLGGYSSGGLLALSMAARRLSLGQPVKGVVLLDTFNTQGWTFRGFAADTDYGTNHISTAINPGAKELQRLSERHVYHLIQHFVEPHLEIPVLLLRAGVRDTSDVEFYVSENGDDALNYFTLANLPLLEVHTIPGGEHADLVGYKDNFATPVVCEVADHIRRWSSQLDDSLE